MKNQTLDISQLFQKFIMACRGICDSYKAKKPFMISRYASGQKRCSICELFMNWDGTNCPCCGMSLRVNPKSAECRQRLFAARQNKQLQ